MDSNQALLTLMQSQTQALQSIQSMLRVQTALMAEQECRALLADKQLQDPKRLEPYGFRAYSQNDEDGIIKEIFRRIGVQNRRFIEFGVQNGLESNCHTLLKSGWQGAWIEGNEKSVSEIHKLFADAIVANTLQVKHAMVTAENVNELLSSFGFESDIDLLSIDIDYNDLYVWQALHVLRPRVVVIEYNGVLPPPVRWAVPYDPNRIWDGSDYCGASLAMITDMARDKGYQLVGCNIVGVNAFFVRQDLCHDLFATPATAEHLYQPFRYSLHVAGSARFRHRPAYGVFES